MMLVLSCGSAFFSTFGVTWDDKRRWSVLVSDIGVQLVQWPNVIADTSEVIQSQSLCLSWAHIL